MILYLMRHGIAEDWSPTGSDADRALTQQGTLRTALVAKALERLEVRFDRVVSSPYVRAMQTAEIVARTTEYTGDVLQDMRLAPHGTFPDFSALIAEHAGAEHVLITGHEPSMGRFISGLSADGNLMIEVKKASVTAIQILRLRPQAGGTLLWSIPPRLVEGIGR